MVRGKQEAFDSAIINGYFNLPNILHNDYNAYLEETDLRKVIRTLCQEGTTCKMSKGEPISFKVSAMDFRTLVWFNFICARLISSLVIMRQQGQGSTPLCLYNGPIH